MSWSNPIPVPSQITGQYVFDTSMSALQAKYADASNWATWAATLMEQQTSAIRSAVQTDITTSHINPVLAAIASAPNYNPGDTNFVNTPFDDAMLAALKARLTTDIAAYHTGLGAATETAMFERIVSRIDGERAKAYTELSDSLSARGFDVPPGSVASKQTEITNETGEKLADASAVILHESATLAANYNISMLQVTSQVVDLLGRLHNDSMMRNFEIKKVAIMQSLNAYQAQLSLYETKGKLLSTAAQLVIDALNRALAVEVEAFKGVSQSASQMVASAINSVNVSSGFSYSGSEASNISRSVTYGLTGSMALDSNGSPVVPTTSQLKA